MNSAPRSAEPSLAAPHRRLIALPERGGAMAALDFGPQDRPVEIVWSHANGFTGRTYRRILAGLGETRRVLAIDLRGHGLTTLPADPQRRGGWEAFADDLLALLAALDVRDVILAGHSLGATTSLMAAERDIGRVRKLVLFEPVLLLPPGDAVGASSDPTELERRTLRRRRIFDTRGEAEAAYRGRGAFRTWPDAMLADYVADGFRDRGDGTVELACAPEWEASNFGLSRGVRAADLLDRCPRALAILRGAADSTFELPIADGVTGRLSVRTVPGTSHFLPMEQPDLVIETLAAA